MEIPKLYQIKHKESGKIWIARSRKQVWKKAHHAKAAWNLTKGCKFDDQDEYEIVDLSTPIGEYIETSRKLLEQCVLAAKIAGDLQLQKDLEEFLKG